MDAIVLVGGQGTRLRPLTEHRHKSLVPVRNRPAIEYLFDWLDQSGFERTVLAVGQHNDDLVEAYRGGRTGKMEVALVEERQRLESGGAIRNAVRSAGIEGRFVVLNGDVFVDFDFGPVLEKHEQEEADLTLALYEVADPSSFGVAVVDEAGLVVGFVEKPPPGTAPSQLVNAGIWIFEPGLVDEIPPGAVRVEETLFPSLVARRRRVLGQQVGGIWADIGTPARYLALNMALLERDGVSAEAPGAAVAAGALLESCVLGPGSSVEARANMRRSVAWEGVQVGAEAVVDGCCLADGVVVGEGAELRGVVAGRGAHFATGAVAGPGTIVEPGAQYHGAHA